jgi:hypothetical protein
VAITYRLYRAPAETIVRPSGTQVRDKLVDYIPTLAGETYWDVGNLAGKAAFYALALADSATHATIAGDAAITPLSPELADLPALDAWLDAAALPLDAGAAAALAADGFPTAWVRQDHTRRHLYRHVFRVWKLCSYAQGDLGAFPSSTVLFGQALTGTFGTLTAAQKQGVRDWVERGLGVDTTNVITATTRFEQAVNFVVNNWINLSPVPLGDVSF